MSISCSIKTNPSLDRYKYEYIILNLFNIDGIEGAEYIYYYSPIMNGQSFVILLSISDSRTTALSSVAIQRDYS